MRPTSITPYLLLGEPPDPRRHNKPINEEHPVDLLIWGAAAILTLVFITGTIGGLLYLAYRAIKAYRIRKK